MTAAIREIIERRRGRRPTRSIRNQGMKDAIKNLPSMSNGYIDEKASFERTRALPVSFEGTETPMIRIHTKY